MMGLAGTDSAFGKVFLFLRGHTPNVSREKLHAKSLVGHSLTLSKGTRAVNKSRVPCCAKSTPPARTRGVENPDTTPLLCNGLSLQEIDGISTLPEFGLLN